MLFSNRHELDKKMDLIHKGHQSLSTESLKTIAELKRQSRSIIIRGYFVDAEQENKFRILIDHYLSEDAPFHISYFDPQIHVLQSRKDKISHNSELILEENGNNVRIHILDELNLNRAIFLLIEGKTKNIYFSVGHGEALIDSEKNEGMSQSKEMLEAYQYNLSSISLQKKKLPTDIDLLVIAGPKKNLTFQEIEVVRKFVDGGGSLLLLLDAVQPSFSINSILNEYGLKYAPDFIVLAADDPMAKIAGQNTAIVDCFKFNHDLTKYFSKLANFQVLLKDARSVQANEVSGYSTDFPLETSASNVAIDQVYQEEDLRGLKAERIKKGPFQVLGIASKISAGPYSSLSRIIAVGSAQFATNIGINMEGNRDLFVNIINFLLRETKAVSMRYNPSPLNDDKKAAPHWVNYFSSI